MPLISEADIARRRQRGKNVTVLVVLICLAMLFYAISVVKFRVS